MKDYFEEENNTSTPETNDFIDAAGEIQMLQTYFYRVIEAFRAYYKVRDRGFNHPPSRVELQSLISTMVMLMYPYKKIQDVPEVKDVFDKILQMQAELKEMDYNKIRISVGALTKAHTLLGLPRLGETVS